MNRLVFDIECVGKNFEELDEKSQHDLVHLAKTEEEAEAEKEKLALWPVTGEVIAIGMLNIDTGNAKVFFQNGSKKGKDFEDDGVHYETGTEKEILQKFWKDTAYFDQFISFNGRSFDGPYLHFRSAVHQLKPTNNLVPYRYEHAKHCDLADQLSYYGASRKFSLHLYAQALGIASPKEDGVSGALVPELYRKGEHEKTARYCMNDVYATAELFKTWEKYLKVA